MNAKVFKNLIKEAVREAVREEIGVLLLEQKKQELNENKTFSFNSSDVPTGGNSEAKAALRSKMGAMFGYEQPQSQLKVDPTSDNPFAAFIADAGANMSAHDRAGLRNLD
jgi:hypothetical protein